jgi:flagellar hook-associated protein 3 FlgL
MRVGDPSLYARLLAGLALHRQRTDQGLERLAGGRDVRVASEDPSGHSKSMGFRARLVRIAGYERAASAARTSLDTLDAVLGQGIGLLTEAQTLAMAGGTISGDFPNEVRADEIEALRNGLLALANTEQSGRFLFSGTMTATIPFDDAGVYAGNLDESTAALDTNEEVATTLSGQQVFLDGGDLFSALDDLAQALRDNDSARIAAAIPTINAGIDHLSQVRGKVGVRLQTIDRALDRHADEALELVRRVGEIEDTDIAEVIVELQSADTASSALSAAASRFLGRSLFDYFG